MKKCGKCKEFLEDSAFAKRTLKGKIGLQAMCKTCSNTSRREENKKYRDEHKQQRHDYHREYLIRIKHEFIEMYGKKCNCCGETEEIFLTLDHIIPRTRDNKNETGRKAYQKALLEYRPDLYQVLCYNCNCGRRSGICPHQIKKGMVA